MAGMDRPSDIPGVERVYQKGEFKGAVVYYYLQRIADALLYGNENEAWNLTRALAAWLDPWGDEEFLEEWAAIENEWPVEPGQSVDQLRIDNTMDAMGRYINRKGLALHEVEHGKYEEEILQKAKDLMEGRRAL